MKITRATSAGVVGQYAEANTDFQYTEIPIEWTSGIVQTINGLQCVEADVSGSDITAASFRLASPVSPSIDVGAPTPGLYPGSMTRFDDPSGAADMSVYQRFSATRDQDYATLVHGSGDPAAQGLLGAPVGNLCIVFGFMFDRYKWNINNANPALRVIGDTSCGQAILTGDLSRIAYNNALVTGGDWYNPTEIELGAGELFVDPVTLTPICEPRVTTEDELYVGSDGGFGMLVTTDDGSSRYLSVDSYVGHRDENGSYLNAGINPYGDDVAMGSWDQLGANGPGGAEERIFNPMVMYQEIAARRTPEWQLEIGHGFSLEEQSVYGRIPGIGNYFNPPDGGRLYVTAKAVYYRPARATGTTRSGAAQSTRFRPNKRRVSDASGVLGSI